MTDEEIRTNSRALHDAMLTRHNQDLRNTLAFYQELYREAEQGTRAAMARLHNLTGAAR